MVFKAVLAGFGAKAAWFDGGGCWMRRAMINAL